MKFGFALWEQTEQADRSDGEPDRPHPATRPDPTAAPIQLNASVRARIQYAPDAAREALLEDGVLRVQGVVDAGHAAVGGQPLLLQLPKGLGQRAARARLAGAVGARDHAEVACGGVGVGVGVGVGGTRYFKEGWGWESGLGFGACWHARWSLGERSWE